LSVPGRIWLEYRVCALSKGGLKFAPDARPGMPIGTAGVPVGCPSLSSDLADIEPPADEVAGVVESVCVKPTFERRFGARTTNGDRR
jgi:hypothetical protein